MSNSTNLLPKSWQPWLMDEWQKVYMQQLLSFLDEEEASGKRVYPAAEQRLKALEYTDLSNVKVVILGQDPYHGPSQAHGLSFSVEAGVKVPPSLRNIFQELHEDIGCEPPEHGDLTQWAKQGVLLLNAVLTVEHSLAASHKNKGWERFTDRIIEIVNKECENVVFLLWGSYAHKKGKQINLDRHLVLTSPHPSPLSSYRGFFGCKHFSKANDYLSKHGRSPIGWQIR